MRQAYGRGEGQTGLWWGNRKERDYFEDLGVEGRILKCILKKKNESVDWINLAKNRVSFPECYEQGNRHSGSVKCGTSF